MISVKKISTWVLSALIFCSIVMTFRLWFAEKLWPNGYNFFSVANVFPVFGKQEVVAPRHEELFMPEQIVVNCVGSRRSIYTESNQEFLEVYEIAKEDLNRWFREEHPESEKIEEKAYCDALKTRSLLVKYPVEMPVHILGQLLEIGDSVVADTVSTVTELVLVAKEDSVELLLMDRKDGTAYRYRLGSDGGELWDAVQRYGTGNANKILSAYELGFYRQPEDSEWKPKLILDPFVMLDTSNETQKTEVLEANVPFTELEYDGQMEELLRLFHYNPNTVRRYTEASDTLVFVSDRSTLRLYPDGLLEYNATEAKYGIPLFDGEGTNGDAQSFLDSVDQTADWLAGLFQTLGLKDFPKMRITSDISDQDYESFSVTMDYQVNGRLVAVNYAGNELVNPLLHGAVLEIQNHRITAIRILLRDYKMTEEREDNMSLLSALDAFSNRTDAMYEAENVALYFMDNGKDRLVKACWRVVLSNGETVAISEE